MSNEDTYLLSYKGSLNADTIDNLIRKLDSIRDQWQIRTPLFKKILTLIIESLENIYKYDTYFRNHYFIPDEFLPQFSLSKKDNTYIIKASNPLFNKDLSNIQDRLDYLKHIDPEQLKDLYLNKIKDGHYTSQGGASLGFIKMARITNNNIEYDVKQIDENVTYFQLTCKLNDKKKSN